MELITKHKALIITALIASTLVLSVFNLHLTKRATLAGESYYEIPPETLQEEEEEEERLVEKVKTTPRKTTTNKAFNETGEFDDLDDDYIDKVKQHYDKYAKATQTQDVTDYKASNNSNTNALNNDNAEEISSYNEINSLLAAKSKNQKSTASNGNNSSDKISIGSGSNKNSTMSYSLVGRTHNFLPTPIYLCENSGTIVITITVNKSGRVTNASYNNASTSNNECLIDHALEYAKNARFSADYSKNSQIGTISFQFIGKN